MANSDYLDFNLIFEIDGTAEFSDEPELDLQGRFYSFLFGRYIDVTEMYQCMEKQSKLF
jgi:hypothetical protein